MTKILTLKELNQIDIKAVFTALGANLVTGSKATHHTQTWLLNNVKFGVTHGRVGQVWYDNSAKIGGAGAAKLIMHIKKCGYFTARDFLTDLALHQSPSYSAFDLLSAPKNTQPQKIKFDESTWHFARRYLILRGLNAELIDKLHDGEKIGSDEYKNVVFRRENGGAFKRGTTSKFHGAVGAADCGCFIINGESNGALAIVEASIDAISLHQLNCNLTVVATGGSSVSIQAALLHASANAMVYAAFDNDCAGENFCKILLSLRPNAIRLPPPFPCKDWNEALQK